MKKITWLAYCRLMRINKPIGALLLLWPTLWSLWLAKADVPSIHLLLVFVLGVFLMRSAGCVINDFADRHFDGYVERTKNRPLPNKELTEGSAKKLFFILVVLSFILVLTLNNFTILLAVIALFLAWIYPFMKRVTHLPQLVLGVAFGWSIPMVYAATLSSLPATCWLLFFANICWTVAYDTQYGMVDRNEDIQLNLKSTAILFGKYDKLIIALLQCLMLIALVFVGLANNLSNVYYYSLIIASFLFIYQYNLLKSHQREKYFKAFLNNNYVGMVVFLGIFCSYLT